ncbi:ribonuclease H-like domain-containing protein [Tanacetum coccineum]
MDQFLQISEIIFSMDHNVDNSERSLTRLMNLLNDNGVSSANTNMPGANQHMTVFEKFLINVVDISNLGLTVGHPNGTQALITKIGDLILNDNITLFDVLVVPEYTVSLLSVHKLSRDNKPFVGFNESNCYIQDLKANKTLGIGRQFNGLYLFDVDNACKIVSNCSISTCFVSRTFWHQRLGDPVDPVLDVLKGSLNLDSQTTSEHLWRVSSNDDGSELSPDNNNQDFINDFDDSEINFDTEELPVNNLRRSSRQTKLPSSLNDFIVEGKVKYGVERVVNYANLNLDSFCFATALNKISEPTCYEKSILDSTWIDAMNSEIEALNENHTWIITNLPPGRKAIGNKWIYKIKYKSSSDIDRYKARLVVKGCSKKEGVDFDETFSPVVKMSTARYIYMTIPKGFASKENNNKVCKLVKSLYGLKQAPRKWNEKLVIILNKNRFVQSINDHSLFTKTKDNKFIALLVYVDDIVVTGNCVNEIDKFKVFLKLKFKIKDLGPLKYFLGIEVIRSDKDLCLTQRKYCLELLKDYGLHGCKPVSTPMVPNYVLTYEPTDDDPLLDNITGYQKLLGKLIYLSHTTPDIAYSVHYLARQMHSPLKSHMSSALNALRYGKGIRYIYPDIRNTICGYSDANWAKCLKTRKSV